MKSVAELQRVGSRLFPFCPSLPAIENSPPGSPTSSFMSGQFASPLEQLLDSNNNRTDGLMDMEQSVSGPTQSFPTPQQLLAAAAAAAAVASGTNSSTPQDQAQLLAGLTGLSGVLSSRIIHKPLSRTQSAPLPLGFAIAAANAAAAAAAAAAGNNNSGAPGSSIGVSGFSINPSVPNTTATNISTVNSTPMDTQSLVKQRIRQAVLTRTASKQKLRQESFDEESENQQQNNNHSGNLL